MEDPSRLIAQDDTAAPLRRHTPTHLETVPSAAASRAPVKTGNFQRQISTQKLDTEQ